ncbi:hypothetical protein [Chitinophaga sp. YIM B06452]|uniref:hypothetical protein n=1 Tax=Chitinophaga sp. YIM B06452 TaxID=3082158 RepID=UPI0031FE72D9
MKKSLASLLALAFFAVSCSDSDDPMPNPEPNKDIYALLGWDAKFSNGGDTTYYRVSYNADSTVKETKEWDKGGNDTSFTYATYLDGKLVKIETRNNAEPKEVETTYFYKDGKLAKISHYSTQSGTTSIDYYDTLYYNAAGKVVEMHGIYSVQPEYNNKKRILSWNGNNVSKVEMLRNNNGIFKLSETEVYTVDNTKPNLFSKILKDDYLWKTDAVSLDYLCENSVTKVEMTEDGSTFRKVRTGTYTYNDRGQLSGMSHNNEAFEGTMLKSSYMVNIVFKYIKQ